MSTTHDLSTTLTLLALTGRDERAIYKMVEGWTLRQRDALNRDYFFGSMWRLYHTLNNGTPHTRRIAEFRLAAILALEDK